MRTRVREVHVQVPLAVPAVGWLFVGFALVVMYAALVAIVVCHSDFSDGNSTVPTTLGSCEPFCAARPSDAPLPQGGEQR